MVQHVLATARDRDLAGLSDAKVPIPEETAVGARVDRRASAAGRALKDVRFSWLYSLGTKKDSTGSSWSTSAWHRANSLTFGLSIGVRAIKCLRRSVAFSNSLSSDLS